MRLGIGGPLFIRRLQRWVLSTRNYPTSAYATRRELIASVLYPASRGPFNLCKMIPSWHRSLSSAREEDSRKTGWEIAPGHPDTKILLVTQAGSQTVPLKVAMVIAAKQEVLLVQVGEHSATKQPVCKLISPQEWLKKFSDKPAHGAVHSGQTSKERTKQTQKHKEIVIRGNISDHDMRVKAKAAAKFLLAGDIVVLKLSKTVGSKRRDTSNSEARKEKLVAEGVDKKLAESLKHPAMYSMYSMVKDILTEQEKGKGEALMIQPATVTSSSVSTTMNL